MTAPHSPLLPDSSSSSSADSNFSEAIILGSALCVLQSISSNRDSCSRAIKIHNHSTQTPGKIIAAWAQRAPSRAAASCPAQLPLLSALKHRPTLPGCSSTPSVAEHYLVVRQSSREQKAAGTLHRSIYRWMAPGEASRRAGQDKYHHSTAVISAPVSSFWGIWEQKRTESPQLLAVLCHHCAAWGVVVGSEHPDWHTTPPAHRLQVFCL